MDTALNLEPAKKELSLPVISEERSFELALKAKKIKQLPEYELRQALRYCMVKAGLRGKNFPVGIEKSLLLTHIHGHYGNHSPEEIRLAFDMAITGKLKLTADEVKCYESFSCEYFSKIMNSYRFWANQVFIQNRDLSVEVTKEVVYTDDQLDNLHRSWTEEFYQQIRHGKVKLIPGYTRAILIKDGLIKDAEVADEFFVNKLIEGQESIYKKE